jgi:DNA transposition AAA+ family ATPase
MSQAATNVTALPLPHVAPLRNVLLMRRMVDHLLKRSANLPGIGVMYGFAGLGKSNACAAARSAFRAIYVEVRDHFTKKGLLLAILHEMGIEPDRTTRDMFEQVCAELEKSGKPLILDMADYLIKRHLVDTVLDIYEGSGGVIVLAGEERFPKKLKKESERFYDRVLEFVLAERADKDDARKLAAMYSPDVEIKDDLLSKLLERSAGVARRVAVNVNDVRQQGKKLGVRVMDLKAWGDRPFYTGDAPERRDS